MGMPAGYFGGPVEPLERCCDAIWGGNVGVAFNSPGCRENRNSYFEYERHIKRKCWTTVALVPGAILVFADLRFKVGLKGQGQEQKTGTTL